jgi:hypothetical protein
VSGVLTDLLTLGSILLVFGWLWSISRHLRSLGTHVVSIEHRLGRIEADVDMNCERLARWEAEDHERIERLFEPLSARLEEALSLLGEGG